MDLVVFLWCRAQHFWGRAWRRWARRSASRGFCRRVSRLWANMMRRSRLLKTDGQALHTTYQMTNRTLLEEREWWTHSSKLPWRAELTMRSWAPMITSAKVFASKYLTVEIENNEMALSFYFIDWTWILNLNFDHRLLLNCF